LRDFSRPAGRTRTDFPLCPPLRISSISSPQGLSWSHVFRSASWTGSNGLLRLATGINHYPRPCTVRASFPAYGAKQEIPSRWQREGVGLGRPRGALRAASERVARLAASRCARLSALGDRQQERCHTSSPSIQRLLLLFALITTTFIYLLTNGVSSCYDFNNLRVGA